MKWLGLTLLLLINYISAEPNPIVLWHGMGKYKNFYSISYNYNFIKIFITYF